MKKSILFFAIIIAMVTFTSCEKAPAHYAAAPTEMTVDGPGIIIPGDSVYFEYQYPILGKWLDCNLKNQGNKKLLGWITKGVWKKSPDKYVSDDELNAAKYSYTGDSGVVILKSTINDVTKVTDGSNGSVGSVSDAAASAPSFNPGFGNGPEDHSYSIFGLGCIPSVLLTIFLILAIWYLLKKLFGGNNSSNTGVAGGVNNQQTVVNPSGTGQGNVNWNVSPDSTITINTARSTIVVDPDSTIRGSRK